MDSDHSPQSAMPFLNVVLVEPEIPPNTGNIIRLCANSGARLHLVGPMGFPLDDAKMRRAGLDYHEFCHLIKYDHWDDFCEVHGWSSPSLPRQCWALTTRGHRSAFSAEFTPGDWLFFGPETRGLSREQLNRFKASQWLRLPMRPESRSLNLSNAVAIMVYEAWRQHAFTGS